MCICIYVYMYICIYVNMYMCVIYIYIYIHIYIGVPQHLAGGHAAAGRPPEPEQGEARVRPVHLLRVSISEGLTQADS